MERLSEIINDIYQKYAPIIQKSGVSLNLDFPDTTITVEGGNRVRRDIDKTLKSATSRTSKGHIDITVRKDKITITDTGTSLSKTACDLLTAGKVKAKSRVGFGTSVEIKF